MIALAYLAVLVPLFALSAIFSASETVLFSLSPRQRHRLALRRPGVGKAVEKWLQNPSQVLSTILAGNTLVNFALVSVGFLAMRRCLPQYAEAATVPLFTLLLLIFGEIGPKQYAMRHAEPLAVPCVMLLRFFTILLRPFSIMMVAAGRVFGDLLAHERRALSDDEFKAVVEGAAASGVLDREEANMVEGVMRLTDLYAMNEMTPRVKLKGIERTLSAEAKKSVAEAAGYPYMPVYSGDLDHIEGFYETESGVIQPPLRVGEHTGLDDLLVTFMKTGRRIALVEDRWGGTAGIITLGDILEVIVKPVEEEGDVDA